MNHYEQAMTDALELREFGHGIEAKQVSPQYAQHVVSTLMYGAMLAQVHATLALVDALREQTELVDVVREQTERLASTKWTER